MKLPLSIVLFYLNLLNCAIAGQSNACVGQTYTTGTDAELEAKFLSEFSTFNHWKRKLPRIFCSKEDPYWIDSDMTKELCACAFYKKSKKVAKDANTPSKSFEEILERTTFKKTSISPQIWYLFIPITYTIPSIVCSFDNEKCHVLKGLKKNSDKNPIYNIYVGYTVMRDGGEKLDFEGIIRDVNVKQSSIQKVVNT